MLHRNKRLALLLPGLLGGLLAGILAAPREAVAVEGMGRPGIDHLAGSPDEVAGWFATQDGRWVQSRELGEKVLKRDPASFAGHYILGMAMHYGEGDLARSEFHLQRAMALFEGRYTALPEPEAPWRWHQATLKELAFTLGEMDHPEPELVILDKHDAAYNPKRLAQHVWPLMKLRRYEEARAAARKAIGSGDDQQRIIARSDLCGAECEAGDRQRAYLACVDALADFRAPGAGGQVEYSNASEASLSVFKYDEAERFLRESCRRAVPDSWGNPYQHLTQLYLTEGRIPEAIEAVRGAQELRMRRPPWLDQHGQARLDGSISELFLLVGITDRAVSAARRAVDRPDRQGVHSGTEAQASAAAAIRLATALAELAAREEEDAVTSTWKDKIKLRASAAWHRLRGWQARRQAAVLLADEDFLVRSLRPYYVGGIDLPMWFVPEAVEAVGGGVSLAAVERARRDERLQGAEPFFDAVQTVAEFLRGDCEAAERVGAVAQRFLTPAEALLHGRLSAILGECARRRGDDATATGHFMAALTKDPGLFRRMDLRLPVEVHPDASGLAARASVLLGRSPRFRVGEGQFQVALRGGRFPEACLVGPNREQLACAHVNLPVDTSDDVGARLLVAEFHKTAFALKADLSQTDLTSLDGSPTAGRADRQVKSLLEQWGEPPAATPAAPAPRP